MSKRKLIIIGGISAAALVGFGLLFTLVAGSGFGNDEKLKVGMRLLDDDRWDLAGRIGRDLQAEGIDEDQNAAWNYLQGVSKLKSVQDNLDTPKNRRVLLEASEHLQLADKLGLPKGYTGKGKFYLGWCRFNTYHWDEASEHLRDVSRLWPEKRSEAFQMQVESQLRKSPPDLSAAQATLDAWRAIPGMSSAELDRIKIVQAHLAFLNRQPQQCEELLADITGDSWEAQQSKLWRTRWRLSQATQGRSLTAAQRNDLLQEAAEIARSIKVAAETPPDLRRQAAFLSGKVLRQQQKLDEALSTFSGARQSSPQSAEAIASGIEEVEILMETGELNEALSTLSYVLRSIDNLELYNELWMPVAEFRARLLDIGRTFRNKEEFEKAISLAELMALAFPRSDSVRLQAEALEEWADLLAAKPLPASESMVSKLREQYRLKYLQAAQRYVQLAQLELRSTDYPDIVWKAITNFQQAGDLTQANNLLVEYLRHEDRTKRPRGFLALGKNFINAAQWRQAIDPLERCRVEHPTHPISFEARLLASKAHFELDQLDQAIELLNENLSGSATSLRPTSDIWKDSLYQLALTIFRQADELLLELRLTPNIKPSDRERMLQASLEKFMEVIDLLRGFVTRYPNDAQHLDAIYLIAKSHRLAAETPYQLAIHDKAIVETARRKLMQQRRALLEQALDEFRKLRHTITQRQESLMLPVQTNALIRNSYFGEADTLYDLGLWEEAITAYQNVASRFLNKPESLEALLLMSQCHRKLGQEEIAKRILAQAEQVLVRIPAEFDGQFVSLTRTSRAGWSDLLGSLRSWD
jgi:tetratricopeptide (TPR) repeat protein